MNPTTRRARPGQARPVEQPGRRVDPAHPTGRVATEAHAGLVARPEAMLTAACLAGVLGLLTVVAWPLFQGKVYIHDDLAYFHLPLRSFYADCLARGDDPTWCPDIFNGFDIHGEGQLGMSHPAHWMLYRALPVDIALNAEILICYSILYAGAAMLLRRAGLGIPAAIFGATIWSFGGFNILHYIHLNALGIIAHIPWMLLLIDAVMRSADPRRVVRARLVIGLLTASQILLGYPQYVWFSLLAEMTLSAYLAWRVPGAWRRLAPLALSKVYGLLAGAIQLIPMFDALRGSYRKAPTREFLATLSLPPINLLQWVAPYLTLSRAITPPMQVPGLVVPPVMSMLDARVHSFAVYNGAAVPVLFAWLAIRRRSLGASSRRLAAGAIAFGAAMLVLAFGDYSPAFDVYWRLPILSLFRVPSRYLMLFDLCTAVLAAVAFADLVGDRDKVRWRSLWPLAVPTLLGVGVLAATRLPEGYWPMYLRPPYIAPAPRAAAGPILLALASICAAAAARGFKLGAACLVLLTAADLGAYARDGMLINPPETMDEFLAKRPAPPGVAGQKVAFDHCTHQVWQNCFRLTGSRMFEGYVALTPDKALDPADPVARRLAGVSWLRVGDPWCQNPSWTAATLPPLPRARLVCRVLASEDPRRDLASIDPATTAILPRPVDLPDGMPGSARIAEDRPGRINVATVADGKRVLVVAESYSEGWDVRVDGRPAKVERAYGDFLGCVVPEGGHRVEFRYESRGKAIGARVSAAGLGLMLIAPAWSLLGLVAARRRA